MTDGGKKQDMHYILFHVILTISAKFRIYSSTAESQKPPRKHKTYTDKIFYMNNAKPALLINENNLRRFCDDKNMQYASFT